MGGYVGQGRPKGRGAFVKRVGVLAEDLWTSLPTEVESSRHNMRFARHRCSAIYNQVDVSTQEESHASHDRGPFRPLPHDELLEYG